MEEGRSRSVEEIDPILAFCIQTAEIGPLNVKPSQLAVEPMMDLSKRWRHRSHAFVPHLL